MQKVRAAIVGAGPAGLGAAVELARRGLGPLVLDEHHTVGGNIYRQPLGTLATAAFSLRLASTYAGQTLLEDVHTVQGAIQHLPATSVMGVFDPLEVLYTSGNQAASLCPETLLLATGACDRVIPFPGWTTPGVITVGGLQSLLKQHGIMPGKRIVLAGSGPLLLLVAAQMIAVGHPPVAVIEATAWSAVLPALPRLLQKPSMLREGFYLSRMLRQGGVRFVRPGAVVRVHGTDKVEAIEMAPVDTQWKPERTRTEILTADCLAIGFGLVPEVALARLAGAQFDYRLALGGWVPRYTPDMEIAAPGVFVAGDGCGIRGADIAQLQGRLAGIAMAERLGAARREDRTIKRRLQETIVQYAALRQRLDHVFQVRPGIYDIIDDETLLCRCEEISWSEVRQWLGRGVDSATQLKMATRVGMGRCQGRFCGPNLRALLERQLGERADLGDSLTARPPVKPLALGVLAQMTAE